MKQLAILLSLLILLTGCGPAAGEPAPAVPPEPPSDTLEEAPAAEEAPPAEEAPDTPEAEPAPEAEVPPPQTLLQLPDPIYVYEDRAVDCAGTIRLQVPGARLQVLRDSATAEAAALAATDPYTGHLMAVYDLTGKILVDHLDGTDFGLLGDLLWYRNAGLCQVRRLSDGSIPFDNLETAVPVDGLLLTQAAFWLMPCELADGDGNVVRTLAPGFRLERVLPASGKTWLVMADDQGRQTLADTEGRTYLGRFYDEVTGVLDGCAMVRDGSSRLAIALDSGQVLYRQTQPFVLLDQGVLLQNGSDGSARLLDAKGSRLYAGNLMDARAVDSDGDGSMDWIIGKEIRDGAYVSVILDTAGQELLVLPGEPGFLTPIAKDLLFFAIPTGNGVFFQVAGLYDFRLGREILLTDGRYLEARTLDSSEGPLLLVQGLDQEHDQPFSKVFRLDGTPMLEEYHLLDAAGPDVFLDDQGLITLDGSRL